MSPHRHPYPNLVKAALGIAAACEVMCETVKGPERAKWDYVIANLKDRAAAPSSTPGAYEALEQQCKTAMVLLKQQIQKRE